MSDVERLHDLRRDPDPHVSPPSLRVRNRDHHYRPYDHSLFRFSTTTTVSCLTRCLFVSGSGRTGIHRAIPHLRQGTVTVESLTHLLGNLPEFGPPSLRSVPSERNPHDGGKSQREPVDLHNRRVDLSGLTFRESLPTLTLNTVKSYYRKRFFEWTIYVD